MGSSSSREGRGPESPTPYNQQQPDSGGPGGNTGTPAERQHPNNVYGSRTTGRSRPDLSFLGIGSSADQPVPPPRESKQERERRKLEKERAARIKERERSLQEEHVDGGYLVTMGVYTGVEDFNKPIVRQLMIERRIAPFWRGLDDFKEEWTEHQLVAAGRGLPIPRADEIPEADSPGHGLSAEPLSSHVHNLTVPITSRSQSAGSDASTLSPSHPAFAPSSLTSPASPVSSSPFRPRSKTLASLTTSKNPSPDMVPREIQLPKDGYVNGQAIEVFLYKEATECPICFLYYPPYLNKTRCCDQPICSECFVQIKRPDPHPPEHEHNDPSHPTPPPAEANVDPESLVSEPAACPYCQQAEFGVTYEVPPFRRGLAYANSSSALGGFSSAMSSSSSLHSAVSPGFGTHTHKRRTTSISANASTVVTTDRVRPDWATKLANARSHLARRSAAATALHTAAYLIGNGTPDPRGFGFSSRSRFGRSRGESTPGSGAATPSPTTGEASRNLTENANEMRRETQAASGRHRHRMEDLEEMMMAEAIRLSLAAEEDRKRKEEKEAAKEAKKKAKEDKKREKKEKRVYGSGPSSASASTMSLSLHGIGRRRGNSGASNLHHQVTSENAVPLDIKGKGVDRSATSAPNHGFPGAKHLDSTTFGTIPDSNLPSPSPTAPDKPSHLRQMSNASSPASSYDESNQGSLRNEFHTHGTSSTIGTPNASGTHLEGSGGTPVGGSTAGGANPESMFNFHSLVAMIGKDDSEDKEDIARHIEHLSGGDSSSQIRQDGPTSTLEESVATLKVSDSTPHNGIANGEPRQSSTLLQQQSSTPEVTLTPETPAALSPGNDDGKQLGANWNGEVLQEITQ